MTLQEKLEAEAKIFYCFPAPNIRATAFNFKKAHLDAFQKFSTDHFPFLLRKHRIFAVRLAHSPLLF